MKYLSYFSVLLLISSCSSVSYTSDNKVNSEISYDMFLETEECDGKGIFFNAVKTSLGFYRKVEKSPFYLKPGRYEFIYVKTEQGINKNGECVTLEEIWLCVHCGKKRHINSARKEVTIEASENYSFSNEGILNKL